MIHISALPYFCANKSNDAQQLHLLSNEKRKKNTSHTHSFVIWINRNKFIALSFLSLFLYLNCFFVITLKNGISLKMFFAQFNKSTLHQILAHFALFSIEVCALRVAHSYLYRFANDNIGPRHFGFVQAEHTYTHFVLKIIYTQHAKQFSILSDVITGKRMKKQRKKIIPQKVAISA